MKTLCLLLLASPYVLSAQQKNSEVQMLGRTFSRLANSNPSLANKMKRTADSLVINAYGNLFFKNHVRFNSRRSGYFQRKRINDDSWLDIKSMSWPSLPNKFSELYFAYDILSDADQIFTAAITVQIDTARRIVTDQSKPWTKPKGFERSHDTSLESFVSRGTVLAHIPPHADRRQPHVSLGWNSEPHAYELRNGRFEFSTTMLIDQNVMQNSDTTVRVRRFEATKMDPWTGKILERQKLKDTLVEVKSELLYKTVRTPE